MSDPGPVIFHCLSQHIRWHRWLRNQKARKAAAAPISHHFHSQTGRDGMRVLGLGKGQGQQEKSRRASLGSQLHCFTNNIKVMTRFCLSSYPGPEKCSQGGGFSDRRTVCESFFVTDSAFLLSPHLGRCITIRISEFPNLIAYTNFIYVTWVHIHFSPPGKLEDPMEIPGRRSANGPCQFAIASCPRCSLGSGFLGEGVALES